MTSKRKKGRSPQKIRVALPPPGLRPKLGAAKVWAIAINMQQNVSDLTVGTMDDNILWDFIGGVLTWKRVAEVLKYQDAFAVLNDVYTTAAASAAVSWITKGVARFTEDELRKVYESLPWCEALAQEVDVVTATAAANWSQSLLDRMAADYRQERLQRIEQELAKIDATTVERRTAEALALPQAAQP